MANFLAVYFAGQEAPGDVQHWKDEIAKENRKVAAANVKPRPKATVPRAVLEMTAERRAREVASAKAFEASMRARVDEVDDDDEDDRRDRRQERRDERRMDSDGYPIPPGCIIIPASWGDDDAPF